MVTHLFDDIVMVDTDDLVDGGNNRHQELMDQLKNRFGKWEFDFGRFYGKDLDQHGDYSIHVSQRYYAEQKWGGRIHIRKGVDNDTPCTTEQIKKLHEKVGALGWISKEKPELTRLVVYLFWCRPFHVQLSEI